MYAPLTLPPRKYCPNVPTTKQLAFLLCPRLEVFFGGAAGPGATVAATTRTSILDSHRNAQHGNYPREWGSNSRARSSADQTDSSRSSRTCRG